MKLEEFCSRLNDTLATLPSPEVRLEAAAKFISLAFSAKPDEVAVFLLDNKGESLSFAWPPSLRSAGAIPLSAMNPLAAQTARDNRGFFDNTFATTPHASFFELFRINNVKTSPIQKIVSVPINHEGRLKGVIQVSRKGADAASAGKDFSQNDLLLLQRAAEAIAVYL